MDIALRRGRTKSLCPSEAARVVGGESWRPLMERTRRAARRLVEQGDLEILQQGRVVDPTAAKGPIRLRITRQARDAAKGSSQDIDAGRG